MSWKCTCIAATGFVSRQRSDSSWTEKQHSVVSTEHLDGCPTLVRRELDTFSQTAVCPTRKKQEKQQIGQLQGKYKYSAVID